MKQYLDLCKFILENGVKKEDRTGTGTISYFSPPEMRFSLADGKIPVVTTKRVFLRGVVHELLWIIKGDTNIKYLVDNGVHIWDDWAYEAFKNSPDYNGETIEEFADLIKAADKDSDFVKTYGELGPVYGAQWRKWPNLKRVYGELGIGVKDDAIDQVANLINQLKNNPDSRRHIISAWNPAEVDNMKLPPCHAFVQFYVANGKLSCKLLQRSADVFLGVPFNITSYCLLTIMLAKEVGLEPGEFIHSFGDAHIYLNHVDQVNLQLTRDTRELPTIELNPDVKSIFDYKFEDIIIKDYNPHPTIKGDVSV